MKEKIIQFNLEIMSFILGCIVVVCVIGWHDLTLSGKAMVGFMVLYTIHEWEESRFPGGFYDLFFRGVPLKKKPGEDVMHFPVAIYILFMSLIPLIGQGMTFLVLIPLVLGVFEGFIHTAGIFMHHLKKPYTPGLISAWALLIYSVLIIIFIVQSGGLPVWQWILGIAMSIFGYFIMEHFFLKNVGLTFIEFRKAAKNRG